jgi:predicted Zn finger-like uncharacterized protein
MTQSITCPECGRQLRLADHQEGKQVRCPVCGQMIPVPVALPPEPEEPVEVIPVDDEPPATAVDIVRPVPESSRPRRDGRPPDRSPRPRREHRPVSEEDSPHAGLDANLIGPPGSDRYEAWRSGRAGVSILLAAHLCYASALGLLLLHVLTFVSLGEAPWPGAAAPAGSRSVLLDEPLLNLFALPAIVLLLSHLLLMMIGHTFCLWAPARYNLRGLAGAALLLGVLFLLFVPSLLSQASALPPPVRVEPFGPEPVPEPSSHIGALVLLLMVAFEAGRLTLLPLFLRAAARSLNAPGIAVHALLLAAMTPVFLLSVALLNCTVLFLEGSHPVVGLSPVAGPSEPLLTPAVLLALLNLGGGALFLAWGALVLYLTRRLIALRLADAREAVREGR